MYEHLSDIKNNRDTTVARHFNMYGDPNNPSLKFTLLEYIRIHPDSDLAATPHMPVGDFIQ